MEYVNQLLSYTTGPGFVPQLLLTVVALLAFYVIVTMFEYVVGGILKIDRQTTVLLDATTTSTHIIPQDANSKNLIYNSENELNGMEFSYSSYLFISPETFEKSVTDSCGASTTNDTTKLKHVFHKGSKDGFPLLGPGVFIHGNKNTLRIYMNSATKWDNYVEIPNIPVGKWFHMVITMKGKYLDVYINGNISVRHEFPTVPKLNYGSIYVLAPIRFPKSSSDTVNVGDFAVDNSAKGMVSRLKYFAYALNYSQIDALYREGPSKQIISTSYTETPPYLRDDWWVTHY